MFLRNVQILLLRMKHEFVEHEFGQAEENMGGTEGKMEGNTIS